MTAPDLRALVAEALDHVMDRWLGEPGGSVDVLADAVLAAVLPIHRRIVLVGAAAELRRRADEVPWSDPNLRRGLLLAAATVTMLARDAAETGPETPLSATETAEHGPAVPEPTPGQPEADRARLAATLRRCAANERLNAERHPADSPDRIAAMRAYEWAARLAETGPAVPQAGHIIVDTRAERDRLAAELAAAQAEKAAWLEYRDLPPGTPLKELIDAEREAARMAVKFDMLREPRAALDTDQTDQGGARG